MGVNIAGQGGSASPEYPATIQYLYLNAFITSNQQYLVTLLSSDIIELWNLNTGNLVAKLVSEKSISNCCRLFNDQIIIANGLNAILKYRILYSNNIFDQSIKFYTEEIEKESITIKTDSFLNEKTNLNSNQIILDTLIQFISEKPLNYNIDSKFENMIQSINAVYNATDINSVLFNNSLKLIQPNLLPNVHASVKTQMNSIGRLNQFSFVKSIDDYKILMLKCLHQNKESLAVSVYSVINELIALSKVAESKVWAQDKSGYIFFMSHEVVELIENWLGNYGIILEHNQWVPGSTLGAVECQFSYWQTGQMIRINSGPLLGLFQYRNNLVIPGIKIISMILEEEYKKYETKENLNDESTSTQNTFDQKHKLLYLEAENAFKEENWETAYNLYLKLVQLGNSDLNYLRYNMAICRLNCLTTDNPEIINNINILMQLLRDKGANDKAQLITDKLKERLDAIKQEELVKKKAEAPWWKKMFGN